MTMTLTIVAVKKLNTGLEMKPLMMMGNEKINKLRPSTKFKGVSVMVIIPIRIIKKDTLASVCET